jgi:hypothetical protein
MLRDDVVLLAAFFVYTDPTAPPLDEIIANFHLSDGADAGEAAGHIPNEGAVAQPNEI